MARKAKCINGMRFGRWVVNNVMEHRGKYTYWECVCDCGTVRFVRSANLLNGKSVSCGCYKIEKTIDRCTKYKDTNDRIYKISNGILQRCNNVSNPHYQDYGGRGIECRLGRDTRSVYVSLLKVPGYFEGASIDRIDNNGHYELENLRWATPKEQTVNRRNTVCENSEFEKTRGNAKQIIKSRGLDMADFNEEWNGEYYTNPSTGKRHKIYKYTAILK